MEATVLKVKADEATYLYGGQASSVAGDIRNYNSYLLIKHESRTAAARTQAAKV
jgi:hypothetical protein